jgi:hypothetical protein
MNEKLLLFQNEKSTTYQSFTYMSSVRRNMLKFVLLLGVFSLTMIGLSQTGPAGVNSNIKLWLDARDLDGDGIIEGMSESGVNPADSSITEWRDKSGALVAGTHFTVPPATGVLTGTPRYRPSEANFDDMTAVEFTPNTALYHDLTSTWSGAHTVFIVFKQKTSPVPIGTSLFSSGIDDASTSAVDEHFRISSDSVAGTSFAYYVSSNSGTAPIATENNFGLQSAAASNIVFYTVTRTLAGNSVSTRVNGGTATTNASFPTDGAVFDQNLLNGNRDTTLFNDCYIAEVIIYDAVLTGEALKRVHDYLNCKYIAAYSGPAPGGIDPCNVSFWLKADLGADSGGPNVDFWDDQSYTPINGAETGGNRPAFAASDNNFNPSVIFNGTGSDRLDFGNSPAVGTFDKLTLGSNAFSIYAVAKPVPTLSGVLFSDDLCTQSSGYSIRYDHTTTSWVFDGSVRAATTYALTNSVSVSTSAAQTPYSLLSFTRKSTLHTIQTHEVGIGSSTVSPALSLSASNFPTERWVGRRHPNSSSCSSDYFDGNISEIIVVRSTVSPQEDKRIQSYLGLKYGLTIPSSLGNYLAGNGSTSIWAYTTHWYNVAGLGQDTLSTLDQRIAKSQNASSIITISTNSDFTSANPGGRPALGHGNYLIWGNDNVPASSLWTLSGAPSTFAVLPAKWRVRETGTVGAVNVQVDVNDPDNDMPDFVGSLYFVHGPTLSTATPVIMTETSPGSGIWGCSGINFNDGSFFTFAVKNDLAIEFTSSASASVDEQTMSPFPNVIGTGTVNVPSSFTVNVVGGTATNAVSLPDYTYSNQTYIVDTGSYSNSVFTLIPPTLDASNQDLIDDGL